MKLIGRELTEEIDRLVILRIVEHSVPTPAGKERIELCKRNITDSLLAMDARKGVYLDDSAKHEKSVDGPTAAQANNILGKPGHYQ